jgi:hypothetical protein
MDRKSKLELQKELRELMRGQPRKAICHMRVHELEKEIDFLRNHAAKREEHDTAVTIPERPRGPIGARKIAVREEREIDDDEGFVRMPAPPTPRVSEYSIKKAKKEAQAKQADPFLQMPAAKSRGRPPKVQNTISYDAEPQPRGKSEATTYTPRAPAEPKCPQCGSTKYHVH